MSNFCGNCDAKLDKKSDKCPNCNETKFIPKDKKKTKLQKNTKNKKLAAITIALILIVTLIGAGALYLINNKDNPSAEANEIAPPDADAYFSNNSTVLNEFDANESPNVLTEAEVYESITSRGFTQAAITFEYSMEGEYFDAVNVTASSSEKHPMYQTYYITQNNEIWAIFSINGIVVANPVSYNLSSSRGVKVIISETETITSYDSTTNKFYETIPNDTALIVIKVDNINSETLENLTVEEIDNYA